MDRVRRQETDGRNPPRLAFVDPLFEFAPGFFQSNTAEAAEQSVAQILDFASTFSVLASLKRQALNSYRLTNS